MSMKCCPRWEKTCFFPKGILSQSAEAKEKAHKFNATIGIATKGGRTMYLPSIMDKLTGISPEEAPELRPLFRYHAPASSLAGFTFCQKTRHWPVKASACRWSPRPLPTASAWWPTCGWTRVTSSSCRTCFWGNYNLIFSVRRKARISQYALFDDRGRFNLKAFETTVHAEAEKHKKVIVLLNFPNNPTGYTPSADEAEGIAHILTHVAKSGTQVLAISDDAYFRSVL